MKISTITPILVFVLLAPIGVMAAGLPPWQFGMTKTKCKVLSNSVPTRSLKNGDLETYSGLRTRSGPALAPDDFLSFVQFGNSGVDERAEKQRDYCHENCH
jgi:hypothetical protein